MIIVTGGAGFIGSNLVKRLNQKGRKDILIVDEFNDNKKQKNLDSLNFLGCVNKDEFFSDLGKYSGKKIDVVFHQGACSDTMEKNFNRIMRDNYEQSKSLLDFCLKNRIKMIYASSASVYGDGKKGFIEKKECESPMNYYASSKHLFDNYVSGIKNPLIPIIGLRYFNVYGPQENHKGRMASVIFHFHNQILSEGKIRLFNGSDNFRRDFVSVDDITDVNLYFFENNKNGIFNCGTGEARSFMDIAKIMRGLYPKKIDIEFVPFPEELKGKYQTFTRADLTNLRKSGYRKKFMPIEKGMPKYVKILQKTGGYLTKD